jgi:hypothetical protein
MMQRLDLDFRAQRSASPWLGGVLLAIAAAVVVDAGMSYHAARGSLRQHEARLAKRAPAAAKVTPQEVAAARETVQRIGLPWDELFVALESAATERVALISIEPDTKAGKVTISADGKDYLAALSYVANLGRVEGLEGVQLVRHEQKANNVTFAVSAAWSAK